MNVLPSAFSGSTRQCVAEVVDPARKTARPFLVKIRVSVGQAHSLLLPRSTVREPTGPGEMVLTAQESKVKHKAQVTADLILL